MTLKRHERSNGAKKLDLYDFECQFSCVSWIKVIIFKVKNDVGLRNTCNRIFAYWPFAYCEPSTPPPWKMRTKRGVSPSHKGIATVYNMEFEQEFWVSCILKCLSFSEIYTHFHCWKRQSSSFVKLILIILMNGILVRSTYVPDHLLIVHVFM